MSAILAIDQGTHASRAAVFDDNGRILAEAIQPVALHSVDSTRVEQDAREILQSVRQVIEEVLSKTTVQVDRAGLATQRSTLVAWDRETGEPLAPAINWQDRRAVELLRRYQNHATTIHGITGLPLSPHYLAGKIKWLLAEDPVVQEAFRAGRLRVGPLAAFLCARLLRGNPHLVDHSNAARSLLFDLRRLDWSSELLQLFGIPREILPDCRPTLSEYGQLVEHDLDLRCVCGDQNAAIHADGSPVKDSAMINIGSGAFILRFCGSDPPRHERLLGGIATSREGKVDYLLEGTVNGAGSALEALREGETEEEYRCLLSRYLMEVTDPPIGINTVGGLGSPWWVEQLPLRFMSADAGRAGKSVAIMESILFLLLDNLDEMDRGSIRRIRISGGLSRFDELCRRLADLAQVPVLRTKDHEATARGVAWLAAGFDRPWSRERELEIFEPRSNPALLRRYRRHRHALLTMLGERAAWRCQADESARLAKAPCIVAHRGYRGRYPENTLEAIEAAIKHGAGAVEFDIQFSRDGEPMIFHDETLERVTGRAGRIFDINRETLVEIPIPPSDNRGVAAHIPRLSQVIAIMAENPRILFFAEVKRHTLEHFGKERVMQRLLEDLRAYSAQSVLISFDRACLEYARRNSDLAIGWVLRQYDAEHREAAEGLQPDYLIVNHEKLPGQERPWPGPWDWMVYEINDRGLAEHYHRRGVDYLSTAEVSDLAATLPKDSQHGHARI